MAPLAVVILLARGRIEAAARAYERRYEVPEGHVILTTWQGQLHEVVCQTPAESKEPWYRLTLEGD